MTTIWTTTTTLYYFPLPPATREPTEYYARYTQEIFSCPKSCSCQENVYHVNCIQVNLEEPPLDIPTSANLLDLRLNKIEILNDLSFSGLSQLASLHLDLNQIMTIRQGAFRGLKNLIYLYLSFNQIRNWFKVMIT